MSHDRNTGEVRRRWVNEDQVLAELEALNDTSMALVGDYAAHAKAAAEAEVAHKVARAKRVLKAKATKSGATGRNMPTNEAELVAEADDEVAALHLTRLTTAAVADATREALRSVRANQDTLRTAAASHRNQVVGP